MKLPSKGKRFLNDEKCSMGFCIMLEKHYVCVA